MAIIGTLILCMVLLPVAWKIKAQADLMDAVISRQDVLSQHIDVLSKRITVAHERISELEDKV